MPAPDEIERELRELSRGWAARLEEKLREIQTLAADPLRGESRPADLAKLHFLLHRLAGSGTSFGFPEVTREAREAEYTLKLALDEHRSPTREELGTIGSRLESLGRIGARIGAATRRDDG